MAGTIVADTLQDGAGNSTSMDNAIYGSAKAWVNFNGAGSTSIRGSYNVSSVTYNSTADYTVNFTNAMANVNYAVAQSVSSSSVAATYRTTVAEPRVFATTSLRLVTVYDSNILLDSYIVSVIIHI